MLLFQSKSKTFHEKLNRSWIFKPRPPLYLDFQAVQVAKIRTRASGPHPSQVVTHSINIPSYLYKNEIIWKMGLI